MTEVGFICQDYNGFTDEKEEEVSKMLSVLKKSHNDEMAKHNVKPIKELYYNAMKQVDDGRPGMALELGLNFFADGNPALHVSLAKTSNHSKLSCSNHTVSGNAPTVTDLCLYST